MNETLIDSEKLQKVHDKITQARNEIGQVIIGQKNLIDRLLGALFVHGHVLLEGVPGLAKTTACLALSRACKLDFQRIQFTPDLLPSDLIGNKVFNPKDQNFYVRKGPVFTNVLLADEINRSPAKVQSALLEAMQEQQVTIGEESFALPNIFIALATQNPIEQEGTFPLPEAQVDRFFFKTVVNYPTNEEELAIIKNAKSQDLSKIKPVFTAKEITEIQQLVEEVFADDSVQKYVTEIIFITRDPAKYGLEKLKPLIAYGASPRGSINLLRGAKVNALFNGRGYITPDDVKAVAMDILRHRIIPTFEAEAEQINSEDIIRDILDYVEAP